MTQAKSYVSQGALIKRINWQLSGQGETLRKNRRNTELSLGDFYLVDLKGNYIARHDVDIEDLGLDLGVLLKSEGLVTDDYPALDTPAEVESFWTAVADDFEDMAADYPDPHSEELALGVRKLAEACVQRAQQ